MGIELAAFNLWRTSGGELRDARLSDERREATSEDLRWIDSAAVIAGPLTKIMKPLALRTTRDTNDLDSIQTDAIKSDKRRKATLRKAAKQHITDIEEDLDENTRINNSFLLAPLLHSVPFTNRRTV